VSRIVTVLGTFWHAFGGLLVAFWYPFGDLLARFGADSGHPTLACFGVRSDLGRFGVNPRI